ncbi:hypothetical protein [Mucilaginibacter sp.]|uniref:hypothetical protein n=1 Tax=Mucilaginibacter sp. TaxID=1882438 RepID=UPI002634757E|nr:hypothetical protein [Mucilaginibacter sp.]MDB4921223.1 hypothetical protein [Mucilaginibacter sp.]
MKTPSNGTIIGILIGCMLIYAAFKHFTEPKEEKVIIKNGYYKPVNDTLDSPPAGTPYKVLEEDTTSAGDKYQSLVSVAVTGDLSQEQMKSSLYEIYHKELNNPIFNGLTKPNAIAVYLYSSEKKFTKSKGQWDMMLWKNITDSEPAFTMGKSLKTANDTESQVEFEKVKKQFDVKGLNYCDFYYQYKEWESEANKMDDAYYEQHPDDPTTGSKKADEWLNKKIHSWLQRRGLPNSAGEMVEFYGPSCCK